MRRIVYRYRISKFKRFTNGLLFALISVAALMLCLTDISNPATAQVEIILPFSVAILSMLMGFITMFRNNEVPKEKI
jgi:choline-glycine betaine transporter